MTFNTPNIRDILNTLIGNNMLVSALKDNGALITREKLLNEYHLSEMSKVVKDANLKNIEMMYDVAELILANEKHIREESIWQLTAEEFLFKEIRGIFGLEKANDNLYQSIFYCYKYCYVSSFFQNNADKFIPQCDIEEIRSNPAAEAFLDAMLKEFDKISRLLDETKDYLDYDKIPWDYIVYLTQLLGLEKDLLNFDDSEEEYYRELAKNILDIYRIKGTTYSFKLFFNFLGIDIEIKEFFFDRRYFYSKYPHENLETGTADLYSKNFYLTTINPSYNLNPNFSTSEIITLNDFSKQENLRDFEELATRYGLEAVLGYSKYDKDGNEYKERVYKYFKTNYIYYYASALGGRANLTSKQISSLAKYLDFLTPIFVMRDIKTVAYSMSDSDFIAFDGDNGDRKYGALIDGTYEGFQMLDGECWDTINKDLYLTITDDGENIPIYYSRNGTPIEYRNSLPEWNDVDTKTFRQPLEFSQSNIFTSRYLGYEPWYDHGKLTLPKDSKGRRVKFYSYDDENGTVYKYTTPGPVSFDVSKTPLKPDLKPITPKIWSTKGRDSVRNEIAKNNYYKEIKYVINSDGNDVNDLLNSGDESMSELLKCSWKEFVLSYTAKPIKTTMLNQNIGGTLIGNTTIKYPAEFENSADRILNSFDIVLFTGKHIENPRTEGEKYFESIYVEQSQIKKHLVVGDYYVKYESGKFNIYRCCYENKKAWFLSKLFPDYVTESGVVSKDQNNAIQLSGNFRTERNFTSALNNFFNICKMEGASIDRYSHLYKIGGSRGYYYAPTQIYTEVFGEDVAKPTNLTPISEDERKYYYEKGTAKGYYVRGYYEGTPSLVGKTFFDGVSVSYDNSEVEEEAVKNNMRYICFWDRQIGDLVYDEYDGKIYEICNFGPRGLVEIKFNGAVKKYNIDNNEPVISDNGENYGLFEYDEFWKGYDEEADADDFIAYNNEHIINWFEIGIHKCKWHRPIKLFTDKLYDDSVNNNFEFCRRFNNNLFYIEEDLQGERTFRKALLRDIWKKTFPSFSEDLKHEFIKRIIDVSNETDDNPLTEEIEGYNTEELFTRFYGLITRAPEDKGNSLRSLKKLLEDNVQNEHYDIYSDLIDNEENVKKLFNSGEWVGLNGVEFDEYYNFSTNSWEKRNGEGGVLDKINNSVGTLDGTVAWKDYRSVDINNNVLARARFIFNENSIKDDYGEYVSPNYLMLALVNKCIDNTFDNFLKDYFYEELLKRWREAFISDDNGMDIDSKDYGLFQGMPLTIEKWNGKAGKFASPKVLNSQFLNDGSDNYSSIKIPLKSITFNKNNKIKVPINDRKNGNALTEKPSMDIVFSFGFADWYYNVREIFGINSTRDFSGRLIYGESASEAINELRENYIKCFSPVLCIPNDYSSLKYFKDELEVDYNNDYSYSIYYVKNNEKKEITSIEQGVVAEYYNGSWVDWENDADNNRKNKRLREVFNKSVIEIKINNKSKNIYLTKKRFEDAGINKDINVLSDCPEFNRDSISISRDIYKNIGYISLKYLRHRFRDNYVSVPNSLDWIKIKNGKRDEYTSYGDDREVASKAVNYSVLNEDGTVDQNKLESKIELLNKGGVINIEDGTIVEEPSFEYYKLGATKFIKKIKSNGADITNKAKKIEKRSEVFAEKLIDKNGDIVLKIKDFSLSDIKQILFSFKLLFLKIASKRNIDISINIAHTAIGIKRDVANLFGEVKNEVLQAHNFIKRDVEFIQNIVYNNNFSRIFIGYFFKQEKNEVLADTICRLSFILRRALLVHFKVFCKIGKAKAWTGRRFWTKTTIEVYNLLAASRHVGRKFIQDLFEVYNLLAASRHVGRKFIQDLFKAGVKVSRMRILKAYLIFLKNEDSPVIETSAEVDKSTYGRRFCHLTNKDFADGVEDEDGNIIFIPEPDEDFGETHISVNTYSYGIKRKTNMLDIVVSECKPLFGNIGIKPKNGTVHWFLEQDGMITNKIALASIIDVHKMIENKKTD